MPKFLNENRGRYEPKHEFANMLEKIFKHTRTHAFELKRRYFEPWNVQPSFTTTELQGNVTHA